MRINRFFLATIITVMTATLVLSSGCGKSKKAEYVKNPNLDTSKPVELRIAYDLSSWEEMDYVSSLFEEQYPNCTVTTESIEKYYDSIETRLKQTQEGKKIDVFVTRNIQDTTNGAPLKDYALNLISADSKKTLDLSNCHAGLVENFRYTSADNTQYAIPYGAEMRGTYVNVTLLKKNGLKVPTNRKELLSCCEVLLEKGYIPFQASYTTMGQQLIYPYICNMIVNGGNYEKIYDDISAITPNVSAYFKDAYSLFYDIVQKGYYDYAKAKEENGYKFSGNDGTAKDFLNIVKDETTSEYYKVDDNGEIPFLVSTQSVSTYLEQFKEDYHSKIEYEFIAHPIATDGGYAYLSPSDGLAINKNSDNIEWSLEFLNFFFTPEINKEFTERYGKIANTKDALLKYDIDASHSCDVGQVTFDYPFYNTVIKVLTDGYASGSYSEANANFRKAFPNMTYYYRVKQADTTKYDYFEADAAYITNNPTAKIYRAVDPMVSIGRMNDPEYMVDGKIKYTLDDYMARVEQEFIYAKATRDGATN